MELLSICLRSNMFSIHNYEEKFYSCLIQFLQECLPQSERKLELNGCHQIYSDINDSFQYFYCLFDGKNIIGTVGLKHLDIEKCELKSLYLFKKYHGKRLGYQLLQTIIWKAKQDNYKEMYLDTLSSSQRAISLYKKMGFLKTERYNMNYTADVFMVLKLGDEFKK